MRSLVAATLAALFARSAVAGMSGHLVDLSYPLDDTTIYWPTAPKFALKQEAHGRTERGYFYAANSFSAAEHGGTHVDAPIHFNARGQSVDALPVTQIVGQGVVVDVTDRVAHARDYLITSADVLAWERQNGRLPEGAILLFRTGFGKHWPDAKRYLGTAARGPAAAAALHFPGLDPGAARWLVKERNIKAVGIDTASIDNGPSLTFDAHVALAGAQKPILENVAAMDQLPPKGFVVIGLPLKITGGTGGPLRLVALVDEAPPSADAR